MYKSIQVMQWKWVVKKNQGCFAYTDFHETAQEAVDSCCHDGQYEAVEKIHITGEVHSKRVKVDSNE